MSRLDDKLPKLKNDIPKISSELDDRVLNAMLKTEKKSIFNWKKLGLIAASATPILAMMIIIIVTSTNSSNSFGSDPNMGEYGKEEVPSNTGAATGDVDNSNTPSAPEGGTSSQKFTAVKSTSISTVDIGAEEDYFWHFDLTSATSELELSKIISKYPSYYQALIEPLTSKMPLNEAYFAKNTVVIVPFVFRESEENISLHNVVENTEKKETNFVFKLDSPVLNSGESLVEFYVVSLEKEVYDIAINKNLKISVINNLNNNEGSAFYSK